MSRNGVPNLPCGVERLPLTPEAFVLKEKFLIYRVELKEIQLDDGSVVVEYVPNLPCGVESKTEQFIFTVFFKHLFLIYRVELKVVELFENGHFRVRFLIYRVELKGN